MSERYAALRVGPAEADLDVGPLISARQKRIVDGFLDRVGDLPVVARGEIAAEAPRAGHYVAPTLVADVPPTHRLAQDEIFGPVQVVIPFEDEEEDVRTCMARIQASPFVIHKDAIRGFVYEVETGRLREVK